MTLQEGHQLHIKANLHANDSKGQSGGVDRVQISRSVEACLYNVGDLAKGATSGRKFTIPKHFHTRSDIYATPANSRWLRADNRETTGSESNRITMPAVPSGLEFYP